MEEYVFSASRTAFYPISLKDRYEASKTWPDDGITVDISVYLEFTALPPEGKNIGSIDGLPVWIDIPKNPIASYIKMSCLHYLKRTTKT